MYKRILSPTDGSEFAEKAERHALYLAEMCGAEIIALSVVETSFTLGLPADDVVYNINNLLKEETKNNLKKVQELREEAHSNVKITCKVDEGSPADVILDTIEKEDIDLVVMGSSGKNRFNRFILGSVAEKVVKAAKCSVLVVY